MKSVNLVVKQYLGKTKTVKLEGGEDCQLIGGKKYLFTDDGRILANQYPSNNSNYTCVVEEEFGFVNLMRAQFYIDGVEVKEGGTFSE